MLDLVNLVLPDIKEALGQGHYAQVKGLLRYLWPQDIVELLRELPPKHQLVVFRLLDPETGAEVFSEMEADDAERLLRLFTDEETKQLLADMDPDDRAALFSELPQPVMRRLLAVLDREDRQEVLTLLGFPEDSAGRVMSTDFLQERACTTVQELLEKIRRQQPEDEALYQIFVVDRDGELMGTVSATDLLRAGPSVELKEIMESPVPTVRVDQPAEEAAKMLQKYDLLAVAVVDAKGQLVGVITADDVIDIQESEATEDFQLMAAIASPEDTYYNLGLWGRLWRRTPWLVALLLLETVSGVVIQHFNVVLGSALALSYFIPMLTATGGNTGSQAATLMVRALATGEARAKEFLRLFFREIITAGIIALLMGLVAFGVAMLRLGDMAIPITVGTAMFAVVLIANLMGFVFPLMIKYIFKLDPAVISGPFISTITDVVGLATYFSVALVIMKQI